MTDDERIGRAWCKSRGKEPGDIGYGFAWNDLEYETDGLPNALISAEWGTDLVYGTAAECYAAVGNAIKLLNELTYIPAEEPANGQ